MKTLSKDWFVSGLIDAEYKRYVLLAYLQEIEREFQSLRLYPPFADLIAHYKDLLQFKENKTLLNKNFPKQLDKEAFRYLKFQKEELVTDDELMREIVEIVDFALPNVKQKLEAGREIYEQVEAQVEIEPIGIQPLYRREGYLLLQTAKSPQIKVLEYRIAFFENVDANYWGISFSPQGEFEYGITNTHQHIKQSLMRTHKHLANPATFLAFSNWQLPEEATLLPVLKRKFLRYVRE